MPISSYSHIMNFQATLAKEDGIIGTHRFMFVMGGYPNVLGGGGPLNRPSQPKYQLRGPDYIRSLRYLCESADIPGLTINTNQRPGYSPKMMSQMPGQLEYGTFSAMFIARDHMSEKEFFDDWIFATKNAFGAKGPGATFDNAYLNDIVIDANILVMSYFNDADSTQETKAIRYAIVLRDLYPISIDPINLNWSHDEALKFNVNFAYSYWEPIPDGAAYANKSSEIGVSHTINPARRLADLSVRPVVNLTDITPSGTRDPFQT